MPTPMNQRCYHPTMDEKDGIPRIEDGEYLIETIGPWCTWIGEQGADVHSTKFAPPERVFVTQEMAERLVSGNAALLIEEPKLRRKPGRPKKTKALEPEENK